MQTPHPARVTTAPAPMLPPPMPACRSQSTPPATDIPALLLDWQLAMNQAHQALASADAACRMLRHALGTTVPREPVEWGLDQPFKLSRTELEVLRLMTHGHANKTIAQRLVITERTVKGHATNIFGKLGVENRTQAVLYALQHGLVADRGVQHVA